MIVIGVDPGSTTGLVAIRPEADHIEVVRHGHSSGPAACRWLEAYTHDEPNLHVAIEAFVIAHRTVTGTRAGALEALYTIGAMRHICANAEVPLSLQAASSAKKAVSDAYLRSLGLTDTVGPHERDALRHALLYARTKGLWKGVTA